MHFYLFASTLLAILFFSSPHAVASSSVFQDGKLPYDDAATEYFDAVRNGRMDVVSEYNRLYPREAHQRHDEVFIGGTFCPKSNKLLCAELKLYRVNGSVYVELPSEGLNYQGHIYPHNPQLNELIHVHGNRNSLEEYGVSTITLPIAPETLERVAKRNREHFDADASVILEQAGYSRRVHNDFLTHGHELMKGFEGGTDLSREDRANLTMLRNEFQNVYDVGLADLERFSEEEKTLTTATKKELGKTLARRIPRARNKVPQITAQIQSDKDLVKARKLAHLLRSDLQLRNKEQEWQSFCRGLDGVSSFAIQLGSAIESKALVKLGQSAPYFLKITGGMRDLQAFSSFSRTQVGMLNTASALGSVLSIGGAFLALGDLFFGADDHDEHITAMIVSHLSYLSSQIESLHRSMDQHFFAMHTHLTEMQKSQMRQFEAILRSFQQISISSARYRAGQHADFKELKKSIEQIGRELSYDNREIATAGLSDIFDRAQDLLTGAKQQGHFNQEQIDSAHKEVLGPIATWAGTKSHGMFNGERFVTEAWDPAVAVKIFSTEPDASIGYLIPYARAHSLLPASDFAEELISPKLWLSLTETYLKLRRTVPLPSRTEPSHILKMVNRGQSFLNAVAEIKNSSAFFPMLFAKHKESEVQLREAFDSIFDVFRLEWAKSRVLAIVDQRIQQVEKQYAAFNEEHSYYSSQKIELQKSFQDYLRIAREQKTIYEKNPSLKNAKDFLDATRLVDVSALGERNCEILPLGNRNLFALEEELWPGSEDTAWAILETLGLGSLELELADGQFCCSCSASELQLPSINSVSLELRLRFRWQQDLPLEGIPDSYISEIETVRLLRGRDEDFQKTCASDLPNLSDTISMSKEWAAFAATTWDGSITSALSLRHLYCALHRGLVEAISCDDTHNAPREDHPTLFYKKWSELLMASLFSKEPTSYRVEREKFQELMQHHKAISSAIVSFSRLMGFQWESSYLLQDFQPKTFLDQEQRTTFISDQSLEAFQRASFIRPHIFDEVAAQIEALLYLGLKRYPDDPILKRRAIEILGADKVESYGVEPVIEVVALSRVDVLSDEVKSVRQELGAIRTHVHGLQTEVQSGFGRLELLLGQLFQRRFSSTEACGSEN